MRVFNSTPSLINLRAVCVTLRNASILLYYSTMYYMIYVIFDAVINSTA
jgi:hypothetical protein